MKFTRRLRGLEGVWNDVLRTMDPAARLIVLERRHVNTKLTMDEYDETATADSPTWGGINLVSPLAQGSEGFEHNVGKRKPKSKMRYCDLCRATDCKSYAVPKAARDELP